ncbi:WS/DGAT domain-containing protein [Planomonospora algeriensis]
MSGGVNITVFSYDGSLDVGVIACREMVPDVWTVTDHLRAALSELVLIVEQQ